jgi:hypothetical protein
MGLTVHYKLRLPGTVTKTAAENLVHTAHSRATAFVRRNKLAGITPVLEADPDSFLSRQFVTEERDGDTVGHEVPPECGWLFSVHPGRDCESIICGLAFYPATIRVGRRTLRTGCGGWGYSGFCKTQYASLHGEAHFLKSHKAVIDLLLLWEKLGAKVKITDEGNYWPGRNEAALRQNLAQMNRLVAAFAGALKDAADEGGPSVESPIFQHGQFELLEAQGLDHHATQIGQAVAAVRKATPGGQNI